MLTREPQTETGEESSGRRLVLTGGPYSAAFQFWPLHCSRLILELMSWSDSWRGRHWILLGNCLLSILLLSHQLVEDKIMAAASGAAYWSIVLSALIVLWSSASLLKPKDLNFRISVLLKGCLLVAKSILLAFPEHSDIIDMKYQWSCVQKLCPVSCTARDGGGYCVSVGGVCRCQSLRPDNLVLSVTILSSCVGVFLFYTKQ